LQPAGLVLLDDLREDRALAAVDSLVLPEDLHLQRYMSDEVDREPQQDWEDLREEDVDATKQSVN